MPPRDGVGVRRRDARPLLREYRALLPDGGHSYNFIQELRFSKADALWLSPAYERDSIWLSLYNIDRTALGRAAREVRGVRAGPRRPPALGQGGDVRSRLPARAAYPRLADFAALAARHDPERKFRNAWLDGLLG